MFPIEMKHVGKIDAVGAVQVFGYSAKRVDEHVADCIYLNYAGPATAADSVWANLIERRALDFTDLTGRPHRLRHGGYPGLDGNEAPFKRFSTRIEHLATDHCILLDKRFFQPAYDFEIGLTFVFAGDNLADKVGQHISQCVDIAVFPEWHAGLLALGRRERLVTPLVNWAHPVYQVTLDRARWTQVIALAVEHQELTWPGEESSEAAKHLLFATPDPEPEVSALPPRAPIARAIHTRQPLLNVTLPEHLTAQGWSIHARNGTVQARGPGRSTRIHTLPGSVATEEEMTAIRDEIVREIDTSQGESFVEASSNAPETIPFTLTHEGDWTWLSFERKPAEWVLTRLKTAGFRWGRQRRAWYSRSQVARDYVEHLIA